MNDTPNETPAAEPETVGAPRDSPAADLNAITRITYSHRTGAYVLFDAHDTPVERVHRGQESEKPSARWQAVSELVVDWKLAPATGKSDTTTYSRPPQPAARPAHVLDDIDAFYYAADGSYHLERAGKVVEVINRPADPDSDEAAAWNDLTDARIEGDWVAAQVLYNLGIQHVRRTATIIPPPPKAAEPESPFMQPAAVREPDRLVIKTLTQSLYPSEALSRSDQELADLINSGWRVAHEQIVGRDLPLRCIRLQRREPKPARNGHRTTTAAAPPVVMTIHPTPVDLTHFPLANAIREKGKEEVMSILNQQVTDTARAAFEARLNQHTQRARTSVPLLTT